MPRPLNPEDTNQLTTDTSHHTLYMITSMLTCFMYIYVFISPRWTESETGAYGFGLDFCVRACTHVCVCVCASTTISRTCMDQFYLYLAQRQHMMVSISTSFFFSTPDTRSGRLAASTISLTCIYRCCSNLTRR